MRTSETADRLRRAATILAAVMMMSGAGAIAGAAGGGQAAVPAAGQLSKFEILPTVFLIREGQGLLQVLDVTVENSGSEVEAQVLGTAGGKRICSAAATLKPGKNRFPVRVPEAARPLLASFVLRAGPVELKREVNLAPQRRWTVYLFHHSHTDIGYTDLQSRVARNHAEYLDSVIDYCRQTDAYPDDAKFRWTIEVAWALQQYARLRPEAKVRELAELIKAGRVELSGIYLQLSDCFAHEELARTVAVARDFARRYGFEVRTAMNNDVNGFSWGLPQVFRQAGVRYFASGINETRSRAPLRRPNAFWWEGPDGSRILHWNGEHYLFANYELLLHEEVDKSSVKVNDYLLKLAARGDYPQDMIAFNISAWTTDNCPPGRALSDRVKEWNERFASPRLRLATMREYFEALESRYGAKLPVHKLGWPDYWTDGVASTAFETGINRLAHNELLSAEKFATAASLLDWGFIYPASEFRDAYDNTMLYDEHTWGAWNSISDPYSEFARSQWTLKSAFAYKAREAARTMLRRSTERLARFVAADKPHTVVVFNPLSWPRTDIVRLNLPKELENRKGRFRVVERATGLERPFQLSDERTLLFTARDVPALGYATFEVRPEEMPTPPAPTSVVRENVIENAFYRLTVDPKTGGLASVYDKESGRELVDRKAPHALNTYIYETPAGGRQAVDDMTKRAAFDRAVPGKVSWAAGWNGPVAASLTVRSAAKMCPELEQRIVLYDDFKRIDLVNVLHKDETLAPEAVYFAFPFDVGAAASPAPAAGSRNAGRGAANPPAGPAVRFEIAGADMAPESEQLPLTTRDWHTVQHWVEFVGPAARVVWSPVEAPLVQFGDINTGKWLKKLEITNAWVYSYAMNNYWMTNFKAGQGGRLEFRYALTSTAAGPADRVASSRFGWEVHTPLVAVWVLAAESEVAISSATRLAAAAASFASVDKPNVIIQALKVAEAGDGLVVRLREIAGRATEVRLSFAALAGFVGEASSVDIVEEDPGAALPAVDGSVVVPVKAFGLQTVKLKFAGR
jgi:Glycosyl hydrolases family 38 N-terminal domain/Glycosyl hydrolases family 38 C-terminal beta sandwich domain/Glycosyl hydrolases family 38 C-terminal domain